MKILDAIAQARTLRDTEIPDEILVGWLSTYDQNIYDRVLSKYGADASQWLPYTQWPGADQSETEEITLLDVDLLLPDKYALELYPLLLVWKIDLQHGDYERYNNDAMMFAELENEMKKDYSREQKWRPPRPDGWPADAPWDGRINIRF